MAFLPRRRIALIALVAGVTCAAFAASVYAMPEVFLASIITPQTNFEDIFLLPNSVLEDITGTVTVNDIAAYPGMVIKEGDKISTGPQSSATIHYFEDSVTRILENTQYKVVTLMANPNNKLKTTITGEVTKGNAWSKVIRPLDPDAHFSVRSNMTVASIRGSAFLFSVDVAGTATAESIEHGLTVDIKDPTTDTTLQTITVDEQQKMTVQPDEVQQLAEDTKAGTDTTQAAAAFVPEPIPAAELQSSVITDNIAKDVQHVEAVHQRIEDKKRAAVTLTPDSPLYFLQQRAEQHMLQSAATPEQRSQLQLQFLQQRIVAEEVAGVSADTHKATLANLAQVAHEMSSVGSNTNMLESSIALLEKNSAGAAAAAANAPATTANDTAAGVKDTLMALRTDTAPASEQAAFAARADRVEAQDAKDAAQLTAAQNTPPVVTPDPVSVLPAPDTKVDTPQNIPTVPEVPVTPDVPQIVTPVALPQPVIPVAPVVKSVPVVVPVNIPVVVPPVTVPTPAAVTGVAAPTAAAVPGTSAVSSGVSSGSAGGGSSSGGGGGGGQPLDTIPPTSTASITSGTVLTAATADAPAWYADSVSVQITATDTLSGVARTLYCIDQANTCAPNLSLGAPITITIQGMNYVRYVSSDNAGNTEHVQSLPVQVDTVHLTAALTSPTSAFTHDPLIVTATFSTAPTSFTAADILTTPTATVDQFTGSGVSYSFRVTPVDQGMVQIGIAPAAVHTATGRTLDSVASISSTYDTVAPVLTTALNPVVPQGTSIWYTAAPVVATLSATDADAATIRYCTDTADTCTPATAYTDPLSIATEGATYIRAIATDAAGNATAVHSTPLHIDTLSPTSGALTYTAGIQSALAIPLTLNSGVDTASGLSTADADYSIQMQSSTVTAGVCGTSYSAWGAADGITPTASATSYTYTGTSGQCYRFRATVHDAAGNATTYIGTSAVQIDTTIPDIGTLTAGSDATHRVTLVSGTPFDAAAAGPYNTVSLAWGDPAASSTDTYYYALSSTAADQITGTESTVTVPYLDNITLTEGTHYLHVKPRTGAGVWGAERVFTLLYDTTAPTTTGSITSGTLGSNTYYTTGITYTLSPSDTLSGIAATYYCIDTVNTCTPAITYTTPITLSTDTAGTYIRWYSTDTAGNAQAVQSSSSIKIDTTAPTTTGSVTVGTVSGGYYTTLTYALTATDTLSGVATVRYCTDTTNTCTPTASYANPLVINTESATNYIRWSATDSAGNTEATQSSLAFPIDQTPPTTTGSITSGTLGQNNYYTTGITYTLYPADSASGVTATSYCIDTVNACTPATAYTTPITLSTDTSGTYIRWSSVDAVGNTQTVQSSSTIKIDTTAPTGGSIITINGVQSTTSIGITLQRGTDTTSGLAYDYSEYSIEVRSAPATAGVCGSYGSWAPAAGITPIATDTSYTYTGTSGQCYQFRATVHDAAGNATTYIGTSAVQIDTATPDIVAITAGLDSAHRATLTSDTSFNHAATGSDDSVSFAWTDPAATSGDTFYYVLNSAATNTQITGTESTVTVPYLDSITLTEGTHYLHVKPRTGAGVWGTERVFTLIYDKTPPTTTGAITAGATGVGGYYVSGVTYTLSPSDTLSSIASTVYCTDTANTCTPTTPYATAITISTNSATNYIRWRSTDTAGNTQAVQSSVIAIDTTGAHTLPAVPTSVAATTQGSASIRLTWQDTGTNITSFQISRTTTTGNGYTTVTTLPYPMQSFVDRGLAATTTYYYRVIAQGPAGSSGSTEVSAATTATPTATAWADVVGGAAADSAITIIPTTSDHYLVAGSTASYDINADTATHISAQLIGNDAATTWFKTFSSTGTDTAAVTLENSEGNFLIAGTTASAGYRDILITKLQPDGTLLWQKTYGGSGDDTVSAIRETSDHGYLVAGSTTSYGNGNGCFDYWLIRLQYDGTIAWQKTYGGSNDDKLSDMALDTDGSIVLVGSSASSGAGLHDAWVLHLAADGTILWQKTYGSAGEDAATSLLIGTDGHYYIAGSQMASGTSLHTGWIFSLDTTGTLLWSRSTSAVGDTQYTGITQIGSDLALTGTSTTAAGVAPDILVQRIGISSTTTAGITTYTVTPVWQKIYGSTGTEYGNHIVAAPDGGLTVVGSTDSYGSGSTDALILHLLQDGTCGANCPLMMDATSLLTSTTTTPGSISTNITSGPTSVVPVAATLASTSQSVPSAPPIFTGSTTSAAYLSSVNSSAWPVSCTGVSDPATGKSLTCEVSPDGTTWTTVAGSTTSSPQASATLTGTVNTTGWSLTDGSRTLHVRVRSSGVASLQRTLTIQRDTTPPTVTGSTLTAPTGGASLTAGTAVTITWAGITDSGSGLSTAPITLDYTADSTATPIVWTPLANNLSNTGTYNWVTPAISSSHVQIRITAVDNAGNVASSISGADFSITTPNGGGTTGSSTVGDLGTWNQSSDNTLAPRNLAAFVTAGEYVYMLGGKNGSTIYNTVQYAKILPDGTLSSWSDASNTNNAVKTMTNHRFGLSAFTYGGYLYALGGANGTTSTSGLNDVEKAQINADGTLEPWSTEANTMAYKRYDFSTVVVGSYVYAIGGTAAPIGSIFTASTEYASIDPSTGSIGSWTSTAALTISRSGLSVFAANGYIYAAGGYDGTSQQMVVERAALDASAHTLGEWSSLGMPSMNIARMDFSLVAYHGFVYALGGSNGGGSLVINEKAALQPDGMLGGWTSSTSLATGSLNTARHSFGAFAYHGNMYVLGGYNSSYLSSTESAPITTPLTFASVTTNSGPLTLANAATYSLSCNGVSDTESNKTLTCEASWDGVHWHTVAQVAATISPANLSAASIDLSTWLGYPAGTGTFPLWLRVNDGTGPDALITPARSISITKS